MDTQFEEFTGTFYFTNPTNKERKYLWNNKEYSFPAQSTVPLVIMGEPLENIQEIRKRFAYRMAEERLYEGEKIKNASGDIIFDYKKAKEQGNGLPPTFDPRILEVLIEECLKPLPIKKANVKEGKKDDDRQYKATKALRNNEDPNRIFAEENQSPPVLGEMPNS